MNRVWTTEHIDFIKQNAGAFNDNKLTAELNAKFNTNFSIAATRKKRQRLSLTKIGHRSFFQLKQDVAENKQ